MLVTAFIGAFVSNTGTVAVMMPIVISMAASAGISTRRYLMPMAFASSMGMFTLISTPPNLVIQDTLVGGDYEPLSFFSFAPIGFTAVTVGVFILFFMSRMLKPSEEGKKKAVKSSKTLSDLVEEYDIQEAIFKMNVPSTSPTVNKRLDELQVANRYGFSIGKIIHKSFVPKMFRAQEEELAGPDTVLRSEDTLYCHGSKENIFRFASDYGLIIETAGLEELSRVFQDYGIAEVFITPDSTLINQTVKESRFKELFNVNVLGIKRRRSDDILPVKDTKLHSGDALLIQGPWEEIAGLADRPGDLVLIGQPEKEAAKVTLDQKAPLAALIMLAMIFVMVFEVVPVVTAVLSAVVLMVITGCIRNMEEAYTSINWNSVVLIGAMIPMATAFEKTGVTKAITDGLLNGLGDVGPYMLLVVVYFSTSLLTMFLSNTATAVLFVPIALQAAKDIGVSPYPFLFAVAVAASMCFVSPFSTPPNALVMSAGHYTFKDYVRVGLPLQVIMGVVMVFLLPVFYPF